MSERWKIQIIYGGIWGFFMIAFTTLYELKEIPFMQQISTPNFYIRGIGYIVVGIFILGYFNWKAKIKRGTEK